jgi:hypothetical protein
MVIPPLADTVAQLSALLFPLMRYRMDQLGVDGSGAFEFYRSRLAKGQAFADYEVQLVHSIIEKNLAMEEIHEIGCGWGQLMFLLAWRGFKVTGFEADERRFRSACWLSNVMAQVDEERAARVRIRNEFFPPLDRPDAAHTAVIATNVVIGNPTLFEHEMIWGLRRYRYAIVDVEHFCRQRPAEEQSTFISLVEECGLRNLGPFCEAGSTGGYYLFGFGDDHSGLSDARNLG